MTILDLYDDPTASVLRQHLGQRPLPAKVASLAVDDVEALAALPDRLFAFVGSVEGEPLRKFAMHDPEHLALSVLYFLECGGQLPAGAQQKVAQNLVEGCSWYDTAPPAALLKVAGLGNIATVGLTAAAVPGTVRRQRALNRSDDELLRAAQMTGVKEASLHSKTLPATEGGDELENFIMGRERGDLADDYEERGQGNYPNPFVSGPGVKSANITGTEGGSSPAAGHSDPRRRPPQARFATAAKVSSGEPAGDVKLAAARPESAPEATHYALPDRALYPIDTAGQLKQASAYFDEHLRAFTPEDRRMFAVSVHERAEALGVDVSPTLAKLAGNTYGAHILSELEGRIRCFEGTEKAAAYEVLLEEIDTIAPIVMYDLLKTADEETGLDAGYGRPVTGFREPLSAVFGAPEKPIYSWAGEGHYVTEEMLRSFIKRGPDLDRVFGDGYSTKFIADPVKAFDKLSNDKKVIIARLANQEAFRLY